MVRMARTLVTAPTEKAFTYADARAFLRLPDDAEEALVTDLVASAQAKVETDTGRKLITQTWRFALDQWPRCGVIELPLQPLVSVTSIAVTDLAATVTTIASANYQVDTASDPPRIVTAYGFTWPVGLRPYAGIAIEGVFGYGDTKEKVPDPLRLAIAQLVAQWYAVRTAGGAPLPPPWMGYDALIAPFRSWGIA